MAVVHSGRQMALNIYRRHGSHCPGGRALHQMTYQADEIRRGWKNCQCPIYVSGTLARKFHRQHTGCSSWDEAKAVATALEAAGTWGTRKTSSLISAPA